MIPDTPRTAAEAREQGSKYFFTGKPCKKGHTVNRYTSNRCCTVCGEERGMSLHEIKLLIITQPHKHVRWYANKARCKASLIHEAYQALNIPRREKPRHYIG